MLALSTKARVVLENLCRCSAFRDSNSARALWLLLQLRLPDGDMKKGFRLVSFTEISVARENQPVGDTVDVYVWKSCGYIELYKEKKE